MFDPITKLVLGLFTGIIFGFLLQKGRVAKFEVIVGQFILCDWTVVKVMGTAVIVGAIGVYALVAGNLAELHIKPALFGGILVGAVCFGTGMAVLGYCPGTSVAGCGEGRKDAMSGVLGMFAGAVSYVLLYPALEPLINGLGNGGKVTLPELTNTAPWTWVSALAVSGAIAFFFSTRRARGGPGTPARGSSSRDVQAAV